MKKDETQAKKDEKECCMGTGEDCRCEKEYTLQAMNECCGAGCCEVPQAGAN